MANCPDCKGTDLVRTSNIIGNTRCNPDCPESIGCEFLVFTECLIYNGSALPCLGITNGMTGNELLARIETSFCSVGESACTAKVGGSDECCGFLEDKIVGGDGITVSTVTDNLGCATLVISENCWQWNNFTTYSPGWRNFGNGYQIVQYSNVKECTVELRGVATINAYRSEAADGIIGVLPAGFRPLQRRKFPVVIYSPSPNGYFPGFIEINTGGQILLKLLTTVTGYKELQVPLELRFEIN